MGATGYYQSPKVEGYSGTFGIRDAVVFEGKAPREAEFLVHTKDDIQLKLASTEGKDIVFQFKLNKEGDMNIRAYDPNVPDKGRVSVTTSNPSLNTILNNPRSSRTEKENALAIRDMFNRTKSGIRESSLSKIAQRLLALKNKRSK